MSQASTEVKHGINDELADSLESHVFIQSLLETKASPDVLRTAVHVLIDRVLDQTENLTRKPSYGEQDQTRSDFLKRSAGQFGMSGHIKFIPEE